MTVGDIVSDIFTDDDTFYYFQPAASVEVMITCANGITVLQVGLYNGVLTSYSHMSNGTAASTGSNIKLGINNTNYLVLYANSGGGPSYSGIQIK